MSLQQVNGPCLQCQENLGARCYSPAEIEATVRAFGGNQDTAFATVMNNLALCNPIHGCYPESAVCKAIFQTAYESVWEIDGHHFMLAHAMGLKVRLPFTRKNFDAHQILDINSKCEAYLRRYLKDRLESGQYREFAFDEKFMGGFYNFAFHYVEDLDYNSYGYDGFTTNIEYSEIVRQIWECGRRFHLKHENPLVETLKMHCLDRARNDRERSAWLMNYKILGNPYPEKHEWYTYFSCGDQYYVPLRLMITDPAFSNGAQKRTQIGNRLREDILFVMGNCSLEARSMVLECLNGAYAGRTDQYLMISYYEKEIREKMSTSEAIDLFGVGNETGQFNSIGDLFGFISFEEVTRWIKPSSYS